jgi:hypothetical protein
MEAWAYGQPLESSSSRGDSTVGGDDDAQTLQRIGEEISSGQTADTDALRRTLDDQTGAAQQYLALARLIGPPRAHTYLAELDRQIHAWRDLHHDEEFGDGTALTERAEALLWHRDAMIAHLRSPAGLRIVTRLDPSGA